MPLSAWVRQKFIETTPGVQSTTPGVMQNYIYRRTSTGTYPVTPTAKISATTSYVDMRLTSGATYCYVVSAVISGGESAKSQPEACGKAK